MGCSKISKRSIVTASVVVASVLLLPGQSSQAASIGIGAGARIDVPLKSLKDLRDENLVKQRFDYSCGAAALATRGHGTRHSQGALRFAP